MKKILILILVTAVLVACKEGVKGNNGVTYKNPQAYNDYIISRQTSLVQKVLDFSKVVETSLDSADQFLDSYEKQAGAMLEDIKGMPPYREDSTLRDAAIQSFTFYKKVFGIDYKRLVEIKKTGEDETAEGVTEMKTIIDTLSKEEEKLDKRFHKAQQEFAKKNNMKLMDNDLQNQVEKLKSK